mmetsp:Transcript_24325/g.78449  ORF Transcript_24325/g.78449 Transcript_24325/m.78449 type:complete len:211 (+) Transcript_24325:1448-2080(+)
MTRLSSATSGAPAALNSGAAAASAGQQLPPSPAVGAGQSTSIAWAPPVSAWDGLSGGAGGAGQVDGLDRGGDVLTPIGESGAAGESGRPQQNRLAGASTSGDPSVGNHGASAGALIRTEWRAVSGSVSAARSGEQASAPTAALRQALAGLRSLLACSLSRMLCRRLSASGVVHHCRYSSLSLCATGSGAAVSTIDRTGPRLGPKADSSRR